MKITLALLSISYVLVAILAGAAHAESFEINQYIEVHENQSNEPHCAKIMELNKTQESCEQFISTKFPDWIDSFGFLDEKKACVILVAPEEHAKDCPNVLAYSKNQADSGKSSSQEKTQQDSLNATSAYNQSFCEQSGYGPCTRVEGTDNYIDASGNVYEGIVGDPNLVDPYQTDPNQ